MCQADTRCLNCFIDSPELAGKLRLHIAEDQVQCHMGIVEGHTL